MAEPPPLSAVSKGASDTMAVMSEAEAELTPDVAKAISFLQDALKRGPMQAGKVKKVALEQGISEHRLRRACAALGVQKYEEGEGVVVGKATLGIPVYWKLPGVEAPTEDARERAQGVDPARFCA